MKMTLKIYRDGKLVNTIESEDASTIYKEIAKALMSKEWKRSQRTKIDYYNNNLNISQTFNCGIYDKQEPIIYKYDYHFKDVSI